MAVSPSSKNNVTFIRMPCEEKSQPLSYWLRIDNKSSCMHKKNFDYPLIYFLLIILNWWYQLIDLYHRDY